jgi:hypothetical protein
MTTAEKTLLAMISLFALGACGESKGQDLVACRNEALILHPNWKNNNSANDVGDYIFLCMKAKGYVTSADCGEGWTGDTNKSCYRKAWF